LADGGFWNQNLSTEDWEMPVIGGYKAMSASEYLALQRRRGLPG
jgi:hypothetical protein